MITIGDKEQVANSVTLDAQGNITGREKLRNAGGTIRFAPPPPKGPALIHHVFTTSR